MVRCRLCFVALASIILSASLYAGKQKPANAPDDQKRALHALDRLTFGPRPGDVQAVAAMGVDRWIEQQLHPEKINDSAMPSRLAAYRTLQMSTREVLSNFPNLSISKQVRAGKLSMPHDPYRHAIYTSTVYYLQQADKEKAATANAQEQMAATSSTDAVQSEDPRQQTAAIVDQLIPLAPEERMQRILQLPVPLQHYLLSSIDSRKRLAVLSGLTTEQRETVVALAHPEGVVENELQSAKLLRAVYSQRQLEEVLTDFWFNHFNIFIGKGSDRYFINAYERDVIRPHVLGKFKDLLIATAQSPAMLFYLDNWQSEGPNSDAAQGRPSNPYAARPPGYPPIPPPPGGVQNNQKPRSGLNENYARELMELHTLGVNGGYTQDDIKEVARVFTGWTIDQPQLGGGFLYRPRMHEPGDKTVLGQRIPEGGEKEGIEVLTLLARQPATARFISTKLAQRFVADDPPDSLIEAMSQTYLTTDGDLREVLRTMFHSPDFWAPAAYRARVKTPFEFVVSSLRATQAEVSDAYMLLNILVRMGQPLYGMQPPTGYSTRADVWVNSAALLDRMNFGLALTSNKLVGVTFDVSQLINSPGSAAPPASGARAGPAAAPASAATGDPSQMERQLEQTLLAAGVSQQTHEAIQQQLGDEAKTAAPSGPAHPPDPNLIAGLLLGSPEFQRK